MVSRQSLKLASGVRFAPSLPSFTGVMYGASAALYSASLQIRARTGFDSQRQYHAFEAHQDEQAALNRQAVGSIPTRRTKFREGNTYGGVLGF